MTVLTTTEGRAVDTGTTGDVDLCLAHVGPFVKSDTRITLTGPEYVAGHGMIGNVLFCARYADRATRHVDDTLARSRKKSAITCIVVCTHVSMLVTAIDAGQDMTASDIHPGISTYGTSLTVPFARSIRHDTTSATKHVAVIGVAILGYIGTTISIICFCTFLIIIIPNLTVNRFLIFSIRVVRRIVFCIIFPVSTFCPTCLDVLCNCGPIRIFSQRLSRRRVKSCTYLAVTSNRHMSIVLHVSAQASAIDRTLDEGIAADKNFGMSGQSLSLNKLKVFCFLAVITFPSVVWSHTSGMLCFIMV